MSCAWVASLSVPTLDWRVIFVTIAVLFLTLRRKKQPIPEGKVLPPGPKGWPIIGHLPNRAKVFDYRKCMELAKEYGSVFSLHMGIKNVVILNDLESIRDILTRKEMLYRSENALVNQTRFKGISTLNGEAWRENRTFCLQVLRDLGYGKKPMEEHMREEVEELIEKITEAKGAPMILDNLLQPSVSNNITALVFGRRFPYEHPTRKFLDDRNHKLSREFESGTHYVFLPQLIFKISNLLPRAGSRRVKEIFEDMGNFIRKEMESHMSTLDETSNRDFIDGYLKKMKDHQYNPDSKFREVNLTGNAMAFFGAGTHTVKAMAIWNLFICANNVETIQRKIQEEIDRVTGGERAPRWEDQSKMPFTVATLWEMYRWRAISPLSLPREASEDIVYKDYFIPKGSIVIPNIGAIHMSTSHWESPGKFMPERFLRDDGTGLKPKPDCLIPFSIGKRMCPGEILATVEVFVYVTALLQKFTVLPQEGSRVSLESSSTALNFPRPQKLRFLRR